VAVVRERIHQRFNRLWGADLTYGLGGASAVSCALVLEKHKERRYGAWIADLAEGSHGGDRYRLNRVVEGEEKRLYRAPVPGTAQGRGCCLPRLRIPLLAQRADRRFHLAGHRKVFHIELTTQCLRRQHDLLSLWISGSG
jgi:hypothetical protein